MPSQKLRHVPGLVHVIIHNAMLKAIVIKPENMQFTLRRLLFKLIQQLLDQTHYHHTSLCEKKVALRVACIDLGHHVTASAYYRSD